MKLHFPFIVFLGGVAAQSIIIDDLTQRISPTISKLADDVEGFPKSGLDSALTIDSDSKDLATVFDTATQNAHNVGSFSITEGAAILADITPITQTMSSLLEGFSAKKDDFNALVTPAGPLILSDLQALNQSAIEYADTLVGDAPITQVPAYIAVRTTWAGAFAQAIDVYSS